VEFADGSARVWRLPHGDPFVGAKRDYRWRKYMEFLVFVGGQALPRAAGRYAARQVNAPGRRPVRVVVTRRSALLPRFGTTAGGPWVVERTVVDLR
jgi:hypothetical protein